MESWRFLIILFVIVIPVSHGGSFVSNLLTMPGMVEEMIDMPELLEPPELPELLEPNMILSVAQLSPCVLNNSAVSFIVDQNGYGDFSTVQAAIDAVPENNNVPVLIRVNSGLYMEKIRIPTSKPFITLQGAGMNFTILAWNDTANSTGRTFNSASFAIDAPNFIARNISFQNLAPAPSPGVLGAQAVALRISNDQAAFYGCGFFGYQDTLLDEKGRHYFKECFIEGSIDFIFGNGQSLYEDCIIHSVATPSRMMVTGAITAHYRQNCVDNTGFSFVRCKIIGTGMVWLGRAWGPYPRVIFSNSYMDDIISPDGWNNWGDASKNRTSYFAEYGCSGIGARTDQRVPWSRQLRDSQVVPYLSHDFIDGFLWLDSSSFYSNNHLNA